MSHTVDGQLPPPPSTASAAPAPPPANPGPAAPAVATLGATVRSEIIKLTSLRATWIVPLAASAFPLLVVALISALDQVEYVDLAPMIYGVFFIPMVVVNAFAVTGVTSEYTHNTVRVTYAATPRRVRVIAAKYLTLMTYAAVVYAGLMLTLLALGSAILALRGRTDDLVSGSDVKLLAMALLVCVLMCAASLAPGYLLHHSAAAVTLAAVYPFASQIIWLFVTVSPIFAIAKWFPFVGAWRAVGADGDDPMLARETLGQPWAFVYLAAVVVALSAIAIAVERRRDA